MGIVNYENSDVTEALCPGVTNLFPPQAQSPMRRETGDELLQLRADIACAPSLPSLLTEHSEVVKSLWFCLGFVCEP